MSRRRRRPRARYGLILLALAVLALPFLPLGLEGSTGMGKALSNAAHFPLLALLTVLIFHVLPARETASKLRYLATAAAGGFSAAAIEVLQPLVARNASVADLVTGLAGVATALSGIYVWRTDARPRLRIGHAVLTLLVLIPVAHPAWQEWRSNVWRRTRFPVLGDFESERDLHHWRPLAGSRSEPTSVALSAAHVTSGRLALEVRTAPVRWTGVHYVAGRADWRHYDSLICDVYNPGDPFLLTLRVDDVDSVDYDSRYNRSLSLDTGWNRLRIPLEEIRSGPSAGPLDMSRINRFLLFTGDENRSRVFFIDNVRLAFAAEARAARSGLSSSRR